MPIQLILSMLGFAVLGEAIKIIAAGYNMTGEHPLPRHIVGIWTRSTLGIIGLLSAAAWISYAATPPIWLRPFTYWRLILLTLCTVHYARIKHQRA